MKDVDVYVPKRRMSPHRLFAISAVGSLVILAVSVIASALVVNHIGDRKDNVEAENQAFMAYVTNHTCHRSTLNLVGGPTYYCDNGTWSESDLIKVMHGRYPN